MINEALRTHVTSAKFVLSLGGTHIAALVQVERRLQLNLSMDERHEAGWSASDEYPPQSHPLWRPFRSNVPGMHGLEDRGLVTYTRPFPRNGRKDIGDWKPSEIWTITEAGQAVITLLKEAGIWQEYADALPPIEEPKSEPVKWPTKRRAA